MLCEVFGYCDLCNGSHHLIFAQPTSSNIVQGLLERGLLIPSDPAVWVVQPVRHRGPQTICRHSAKGWSVQLRPLQEVAIIIIKLTTVITFIMIGPVPNHNYDYDYDDRGHYHHHQCDYRGHQHEYGGAGVEDKWRHTYPYVPTRSQSHQHSMMIMMMMKK